MNLMAQGVVLVLLLLLMMMMATTSRCRLTAFLPRHCCCTASAIFFCPDMPTGPAASMCVDSGSRLLNGAGRGGQRWLRGCREGRGGCVCNTAGFTLVCAGLRDSSFRPPPPGSSRWCLVDFGSSGRLGLIPSPFATLERLDRVLQDLGIGGWLPLHQAAEELRNRHPHHGQHHDYQDGREGAAGSVADDEERRAAATTAAAARGPPAPAPAAAGVHDLGKETPTEACTGVDDGGGSGEDDDDDDDATAAGASMGLEIICPLHFDQPFGGYRVAHLGLSPPTLDRDVLFGSSSDFVGWDDALGAPRGGNLDDDDPRVGILTSTFRCALQADKLQAARRMAQDLAEEGSGLSVAAAALLRAAYNGI
ncbi:hypothetical protein VOLCADRAFT_106293 [Volvox carteri f. nagariensis]|uniref:Uncharacterized protein n=1 Tax=Volvox carteri f. nagariensis TaxID=3068 RepID=D8U6E6_VOLCA|nr:uncharacterized protein VOLCADRAFT_106293 [Volvox carteri f. nagariensis]EFJ44703.1 hypothetical protein VOLCADRAFT_106293 [Volvox carteri f. nagariensis]|eukprot:XP_002954279.1 hypothetical protein VOLCADRAFT_106293 [Volvox carteri f. nagariensis]